MRARTRSRMLALVRQWETSGETRRAFCGSARRDDDRRFAPPSTVLRRARAPPTNGKRRRCHRSANRVSGNRRPILQPHAARACARST
jgi:hypothetical protein